MGGVTSDKEEDVDWQYDEVVQRLTTIENDTSYLNVEKTSGSLLPTLMNGQWWIGY